MPVLTVISRLLHQLAGSKKRKQTDLSWEMEIRREGDLIREVGKGLTCGTELGFRTSTVFL